MNRAIFASTLFVVILIGIVNIYIFWARTTGKDQLLWAKAGVEWSTVKKDFKTAGAEAILEQDKFAGKTVVEALHTILQNPDEETREQQFRTVLSKMTPADAPGIQKLFTDGNKLGRWYIPEYHAFMAQWGKSDGPAAAQWALKNYQQYESPLVQRMIGGWVRSNPTAAVDWLNNTDMPDWMQDSALEGLVKGLAADNVKMAGDLALSNLDSPAAPGMLASILDSYVYRDNGLVAAEEWLKSIGKTEGTEPHPALFGQLMDRTLRAGDYAAGAALITRNANEEWCTPTAIRRVIEGYASAGHTDQLLPWLSNLPEGNAKKVAQQFVQEVAPLVPLSPPPPVEK